MKKIKITSIIVLAILLLIPFLASSASASISLGGTTWGGQSLNRQNTDTWYIESTKTTFNEDGTGTSVCKSNYSEGYTESTENFTYTVSLNGDGSFTLNVITGGETDDIRFVMSDDETMIILDGTRDTDEVWMEILIKLGAEGTYGITSLTGDSYKIGYEHDALGGDKGYYRAESGISSATGDGTLIFTAEKLNGDGAIIDNSGGTVQYIVNTDGSVNIGDITGFLSGNGFCSVFSNPASTDDWMNIFSMAKEDDGTYSNTDLEGTWAFTGFGDYGGTVFHAEIGTMTCDSAGNSTYSLKVRHSDGSISYISGSETLSVATDGSFGLSLPGGISYAGAIGNNGNTLVMNRSFAPDNLNYRDVIVAVKCSTCSNLAGWNPTADEQAIHTQLQAAIDAYNAQNLTGFMVYISANYLDDGMSKQDFSDEAQEEMSGSDFEQLSYMILNTTVDGDTATTQVAWADGETENMHWFKEGDIWMLHGNQKKYGVDAWSQNWNNGLQYMVHFQVDDPNLTADSVKITGPGIPPEAPLSLDYDTAQGSWNSWHTYKSLDFDSTPPAPPLEYEFTVVYGDPAETFTDTCTVRSFVSVLATALSTSGAGTAADPLVFSWEGVGAGGYTYQVQLSYAGGSRIWDSDWNLTTTSVNYDGDPLTPGAQYHYQVVVEDMYGNESFAEGSFTQSAALPGDVDNSGSVDLTDAILALQVVAGMNTTGVNLGADVNSDNKIGMAEVIYILQYVAGFRQ